MDIAVVGPGAVGTTIAAYLSAAGHEVLVCGRSPRTRIELRPDERDPIVVPGPVRTDPAQVAGPAGFVLLAVKSTQNADAARWLARLCDEHTVVVVLQNGVEQVEQVQPLCPSSTVIPGIVWFSAETQPDGWVRLRGKPGWRCRPGPLRRRSPKSGAPPEAPPTAIPTSPRPLGASCWSTPSPA